VKNLRDGERMKELSKVNEFIDIKMLVMDVDGTLTNGDIYISENGEIMKAFNVKDGLGISVLLKEEGVIPAIITGRKSKIIDVRANELGVNEIYQGIDNKVRVLKNIAIKYAIDLNNIAYIGDDINDLECIKICGVTACPQDSSDTIKKYVDYVCKMDGGRGAVREFIEFLFKLRKVQRNEI
jgi:3-deoxy-D-manno-octulosonate 8-phosphate phosphatase (KDO 8-P phosphatase)